jgi:hypothetical protein
MENKDLTVADALDEADVRRLVDRITASLRFQRAPQLRRFLQYACARALESRSADISEYEIATQVLGRRPEFNPKEDNIVRVQARHLREKLAEYFASEGLHERLVITIPKGSYLPQFSQRPGPVTPAHPTPGSAETPARTPFRNRLWLVLACFLAGAFAMVLFPYARARPPRTPDALWSRVFVAGRKTNIVVADTCRVALQSILKTEVPLKDYLRTDYPHYLFASVPAPLQSILHPFENWQFTALADTVVGSQLMKVGESLGAQCALRFPRRVDVSEFKTDNFVLLGSRFSIAWVELFEPALNYCIERDGSRSVCFLRNRSPREGQPAEFRADLKTGETYASVALLPNLDGSGTVLIFNAIDMPAAEAAAEYVLRGELSRLLSRQGPRSAQPRPFVELLLRVSSTARTAASSELLDFRTLVQ